MGDAVTYEKVNSDQNNLEGEQSEAHGVSCILVLARELQLAARDNNLQQCKVRKLHPSIQLR